MPFTNPQKADAKSGSIRKTEEVGKLATDRSPDFNLSRAVRTAQTADLHLHQKFSAKPVQNLHQSDRSKVPKPAHQHSPSSQDPAKERSDNQAPPPRSASETEAKQLLQPPRFSEDDQNQEIENRAQTHTLTNSESHAQTDP